MPYKNRKPCKHPGCPALTYGTYCDAHKKSLNKQYNMYIRDEQTQKFYESKAWRRVRKMKLAINILCEDCGKEVATEVHHIKPITEGGAPLAFENLKSLCKSCHSKYSPLATRKCT